MIKSIALSFGYVEDNSVSWLIFGADRKLPANRKEAIESLAEYLYQKFIFHLADNADFDNEYKNHMAKCCRNAWSKRDYANPPERCPNCQANYSVKVEATFHYQDWMAHICNLSNTTCDSYGEHDEIDNPFGWSPWSYNFAPLQHEMLIVQENAEHMLTLALKEKHPEIKSHKDDGSGDSYIVKEYNKLCDESLVFMNYGYTNVKNYARVIANTTYKYPNGAEAVVEDGELVTIKYDSGDQVWFRNNDPIRVLTHDGIEWTETEGSHLGR